MEISLPVTLAVLGAALLHAGWNALVTMCIGGGQGIAAIFERV